MTSHDRSEELRHLLDGGLDLDAALSNMRSTGASWGECIVSLQKVRGCRLAEAKRLVEGSPAWADVMNLEGWGPAQPNDICGGEELKEKNRLAALSLIESVGATQQQFLLRWVTDLLELRTHPGPALTKASSAVRRTLTDSAATIPRLQAVEAELGVSAMEIPVWIAVGAGDCFGAVLLEELQKRQQ